FGWHGPVPVVRNRIAAVLANPLALLARGLAGADVLLHLLVSQIAKAGLAAAILPALGDDKIVLIPKIAGIILGERPPHRLILGFFAVYIGLFRAVKRFATRSRTAGVGAAIGGVHRDGVLEVIKRGAGRNGQVVEIGVAGGLA